MRALSSAPAVISEKLFMQQISLKSCLTNASLENGADELYSQAN
jgi:hypothetical protein